MFGHLWGYEEDYEPEVLRGEDDEFYNPGLIHRGVEIDDWDEDEDDLVEDWVGWVD